MLQGGEGEVARYVPTQATAEVSIEVVQKELSEINKKIEVSKCEVQQMEKNLVSAHIQIAELQMSHIKAEKKIQRANNLYTQILAQKDREMALAKAAVGAEFEKYLETVE